jgi:hypothetical protein
MLTGTGGNSIMEGVEIGNEIRVWAGKVFKMENRRKPNSVAEKLKERV